MKLVELLLSSNTRDSSLVLRHEREGRRGGEEGERGERGREKGEGGREREREEGELDIHSSCKYQRVGRLSM